MFSTKDKREEKEQSMDTYIKSFFFKAFQVTLGREKESRRKKKKSLGKFIIRAYCYISSSILCISNLL